MRLVTSTVVVLGTVVVLATGAESRSTGVGVQLCDVTLAGKVHCLARFDPPFRYALSPGRVNFAYVPRSPGNGPSDELRISDTWGRDPVAVHAPGGIVDLAWAPTASWIAMSVVSGTNNATSVWLVQPDGTHLQPIAESGFNLAWSPDSRELAMERRGARIDTIQVLTLATGAVRDIAEGSFPSWSPDGKSILYSWQDTYAHSPAEIRTVSADGGYAKTVTEGWGPAWSPDGKRIAFSRGDLWVVPSYGGYGRLLAHGSSSAMWLPSGRALAFTVGHSSHRCGRRTTVSIVPLRGGKPRRLLMSKTVAEPLAWNGRGTKLIYLKTLC